MRFFQLLLSPFVSTFNLHLVLTNYVFVWSENSSIPVHYIIFPLIIMVICFFSLKQLDRHKITFILIFFLFSLLGKSVLLDYDIRYNIYLNLIVSYLFVQFLSNYKYLVQKKIFLFIFITPLIMGYFFYNYLNVHKNLVIVDDKKIMDDFEKKKMVK